MAELNFTNLPKFVKTTAAGYAGIASKNANTLYFLTDEHMFYLGSTPFTFNFVSAAAAPSGTGKINTIYYNTATSEAYIWDGSAYQKFGVNTTTSIPAEAYGTGEGDNIVPTAKAVKTYVDGKVTALGNVFEFQGTKADMTALNAVTGMKAGDVWIVTDAGTDADGNALANAEYVYTGTAWEPLGTTVDLTGYAEKATPTAAGEIATLAADGDLVASGKSIGGSTLSITNDAASADVVATEAGVKAYTDGAISDALQDVADGYLPQISSGVNGNVVTVASNGEAVADSGYVLGGSTLAYESGSSSYSSSKLATEAAVAAALQGLIDEMSWTTVSAD